jgi:uncharacterized protein YecT (DUF1311 family)
MSPNRVILVVLEKFAVKDGLLKTGGFMIRLSVLALALVAGTAGAAPTITDKQVEARYSAEFNHCMKTGDAANGVTSAMLDCVGDEHNRQDARLNEAYRVTMARLSTSQKLDMRESERKWIKFRDDHCQAAAGDEAGGTLGTVMINQCALDETIRRVIWIENYMRK